MDKDKGVKLDMPDFSCDFDVISFSTRFGPLQVLTAYERNLQELCFNLFT